MAASPPTRGQACMLAAGFAYFGKNWRALQMCMFFDKRIARRRGANEGDGFLEEQVAFIGELRTRIKAGSAKAMLEELLVREQAIRGLQR